MAIKITFLLEDDLDPIRTEREIEELQQMRLKRLRRPTFDEDCSKNRKRCNGNR